MNRFYFERQGDSNFFHIFDRQWSNTVPIAMTNDVNVAEMICMALNQMWERPQ
jgi:hypothetical protein